MAVDSHHIYWTNETTGTIGRANLEPVAAAGSSGPYLAAPV